MTFLKLAFVATVLVGTATIADAAVAVGGKYKVVGTNFDGSKYSGEATITVTTETTCTIEWQTGADSSSVGICMRNDDSFAAAYKMKDGAIGLIIYKMTKDGEMDGVWTLTGKDGAGTEVLTPEN